MNNDMEFARNPESGLLDDTKLVKVWLATQESADHKSRSWAPRAMPSLFANIESALEYIKSMDPSQGGSMSKFAGYRIEGPWPNLSEMLLGPNNHTLLIEESC